MGFCLKYTLKRLIIALLASLAFASAATAENDLKNGEFTCVATLPGNISASLTNLTFESDALRVNNFILNRMLGSDISPTISMFQLAASAVNTGKIDVFVSVELVVFNQNSVVFAMDAVPPWGPVKARRIADMKGYIFLPGSAVPVKADKACIRVTAGESFK